MWGKSKIQEENRENKRRKRFFKREQKEREKDMNKKKGNKKGTKKANHFWFNAVKPEKATTNDFAHHFMRHIRNAFAHGLIEVSYQGRQRQKYYLIKDFERHGEQSMSGYIRSDLFWQMIWYLYQTRK